MPYYCTVPRCTSMAGKVKNVSFHQFPRDEELARLWNKILKRGKPYTKYSKVCSLHFTPEDYTITSVGKNKGQWRTLRKDAVPSQNLPTDSPGPQRQNSNGFWIPDPLNPMDPQLQQIAQAVYVQTMMAMHSAAAVESCGHSQLQLSADPHEAESDDEESPDEEKQSYRCNECSKCFKDKDVFTLHRCTHMTNKENQHSNSEDTLKANPILANLLRNSTNARSSDENLELSINGPIMSAFAMLKNTYLRNFVVPRVDEGSSNDGMKDDERSNELGDDNNLDDDIVKEDDSISSKKSIVRNSDDEGENELSDNHNFR